jgi:hypothetical protein
LVCGGDRCCVLGFGGSVYDIVSPGVAIGWE